MQNVEMQSRKKMFVVNNGDGDTIHLESSTNEHNDIYQDSEIYKAVCAFLNSFEGGEVKVRLSTEVLSTLDLKSIEQKLIELFGKKTQTIRLSVNTFNQELVCTVGSRSNIFWPWNCQHYSQFPYVLDYHYYRSIGTQISVMKPTEFAPTFGRLVYPSEEGLFERSEDEECPIHNTTKFIRGQVPVGFQKSNTMQFANRIVLESNKLQKTTSGFANSKGGKLFYGIVDETGQVQGQKVGEEEKKKIKQEVDSALSNMIWPTTITSETDRPWKIDFEPVHDKDGDVIPETYVIVISVAKCPGGVFVKAPESYYILGGEVVEMPFDGFKKKALWLTGAQ